VLNFNGDVVYRVRLVHMELDTEVRREDVDPYACRSQARLEWVFLLAQLTGRKQRVAALAHQKPRRRDAPDCWIRITW